MSKKVPEKVISMKAFEGEIAKQRAVFQVMAQLPFKPDPNYKPVMYDPESFPWVKFPDIPLFPVPQSPLAPRSGSSRKKKKKVEANPKKARWTEAEAADYYGYATEVLARMRREKKIPPDLYSRRTKKSKVFYYAQKFRNWCDNAGGMAIAPPKSIGGKKGNPKT